MKDRGGERGHLGEGCVEHRKGKWVVLEGMWEEEFPCGCWRWGMGRSTHLCQGGPDNGDMLVGGEFGFSKFGNSILLYILDKGYACVFDRDGK